MLQIEQIEECTVEASIFEQSVKKLKLASSNYLSRINAISSREFGKRSRARCHRFGQ